MVLPAMWQKLAIVRLGRNGALAQLGEHRFRTAGVEGSSPSRSTNVGANAAAATFDASVAQVVERQTEDLRVGGSTPPAGTMKVLRQFRLPVLGRALCAGVAQCVEHSADNRKVAGSNPVSGTAFAQCRIPLPVLDGLGVFAGVAQTVERLSRKQRVAGSKPVPGPRHGTTGTTETAKGRVPKWSNGPDCKSGGLVPSAGSNPPSPTGRIESRGYYRGERVVETVKTVVCKTTNAGSIPATLSGRIESRECRRTVVERYNTALSMRMVGVRVPSVLPCRRQDGDTTDAFEHRAGVAQLVECQPSKLDVAGSRPVSRSSERGSLGGCGSGAVVAHRLAKSDVAGSIPVSRSMSVSSVSP